MFLTVWLKRQEQELQKVRILAQGMLELGQGKESGITGAYKEFLAALLPYTKKEQASKDEEMRQMMRREADKGVIVFKTPSMSGTNPLGDRAKQMLLPDEFRQKLANRKAKRVVDL